MKVLIIKARGALPPLAAAVCMLLPCGAARANMQGGYYTLDAGRVVGISGQVQNGDTVISQIFGEAVGLEFLNGGDITVQSPGVADVSAAESSLANAFCYPSPFRPARGHTKLTFAGLTAHVALKIFDISGALVYRTEQDTPEGKLEWGVINDDGAKLASGVYIFLLKSSAGDTKVGRFAVIR